MRVELIGHLKAEAGGEYVEIKVSSGGENLVEALKKLPEKVRHHVIDEKTGKIATGLLILVNGSEIKPSQVAETKVKEDDVVTLIPAIHGGTQR